MTNNSNTEVNSKLEVASFNSAARLMNIAEYVSSISVVLKEYRYV